MKFFIEMIPPTVTAQMKKVRVVRNKPIYYDPPKVKEAKKAFCYHLTKYKPPAQLKGAVSLKVVWLFPKGKSHKDGEWRITKPDTDNIEKLLKDCMTKVGFWKDDSQVAREVIEKRWSDEPYGIEIEVEEMENVQKS
ncbi:MAG: RusA family crossover junction endodeoxyribonuclease [Oscillospiraceae bacterium]|nr:RusA family crossover junction endodeoxyribonuclease [Oscillospiraceae bacterium]